MPKSNSTTPATVTSPHEIPRIEKVNEASLKITGLPASQAQHLENIERILHQIKHLASHGTIQGRKAAEAIKAAGLPFENSEFRIGISYTVKSQPNGTILIHILWNTVCPTVVPLDVSRALTEGNSRPMTDEEIREYFERAVNLCICEIDIYLQDTFAPHPAIC